MIIACCFYFLVFGSMRDVASHEEAGRVLHLSQQESRHLTGNRQVSSLGDVGPGTWIVLPSSPLRSFPPGRAPPKKSMSTF